MRKIETVDRKLKMTEVVSLLCERELGRIKLAAQAEKQLRQKLVWFMNQVMYPQKLEETGDPKRARLMVIESMEEWKKRTESFLLNDTHPVLTETRWGDENTNGAEQTGFYAELLREDIRQTHNLDFGIWEGMARAHLAEHAIGEEDHPTQHQFWGALDRWHFERYQTWLGHMFDQTNAGTPLTALQAGRLREAANRVNKLRFGSIKQELRGDDNSKLRLGMISYRTWAVLRRDIAVLLGEELKPWMENADDPNHGYDGDVCGDNEDGSINPFNVNLVGDAYQWLAEQESGVPEDIEYAA